MVIGHGSDALTDRTHLNQYCCIVLYLVWLDFYGNYLSSAYVFTQVHLSARPPARPPARLAVCPSVRLSTCPSIRLSVWLSGHLSICPSGCLVACPSVHLSVCPSGSLAVWQSGSLAVWQSGSLAVWPSGRLAVRPSRRLAVCPSVHLAVCPSVRLAVWQSGRPANIVTHVLVTWLSLSDLSLGVLFSICLFFHCRPTHYNMLHNFRDSLLTGAYKCFLCCLFVYLPAGRISCIVGFFC